MFSVTNFNQIESMNVTKVAEYEDLIDTCKYRIDVTFYADMPFTMMETLQNCINVQESLLAQSHHKVIIDDSEEITKITKLDPDLFSEGKLPN
jgi:hypothetical protein